MKTLRAYKSLIKFRVDLMVALTALFGYLIGSKSFMIDTKAAIIFAGGFLVTATAHIINQIIERKYDAQMSRTKSRPLATGQMRILEAIAWGVVLSGLGLWLLYEFVGYKVFLISFVSLVTYAFIYTPLKRINRIAVYIGAIPGALPIVIGYVGATGKVDMFAMLLFLLQVIWQLPHFWSIAWIWHDEYRKAGYDLLPVSGGKNHLNAFITFFSVVLIFPIFLFLYYLGFLNMYSFTTTLLFTFIFLYAAFRFYQNQNRTFAKKLMWYSIIYLPVVQLIIILQTINN